MKLTVITSADLGDYYEYRQLSVSEDTVECASEDPDDYRAALCKWMESRSIEDMWVFAGEPIPFDHEAEKARMVAEAKERKRIADAEALAKNAEEARDAKPPGVRDRELEAIKARLATAERCLEAERAERATVANKSRNWELSASRLATRVAGLQSKLIKAGLDDKDEDDGGKFTHADGVLVLFRDGGT